MNEDTTFSQNMDSLFCDLHNFVKTDSVLGTPVKVEDKTLVPLMSVTLGYGTTGAGKKAQNENTSGMSNGVGLGARISANGVIVVDKDSVSMIPANEKSNMGQLMDKIPQVLSSLGQNMPQNLMGQGKQNGQENHQNQQNQNNNQESPMNTTQGRH